MSCKKFSVIVPLYNKRDDIGNTLTSILSQSVAPHEIVVVDDGSTDGSADVVRSFASPLIRLILQRNAGECAARNRAIKEATGDYMALLDADDTWQPDYLKVIDALIDKYPDCGLYSTGCNIISNDGSFPWESSQKEGVVDNYFLTAMTEYICLPSSSTIPLHVFDRVGGFPEGMKLGGDQFMWVKIASEYKICFTPERMLNYNTVATNRSSSIYTPEQTVYSFRDFYDETNFYRNEFIARCEIGKALTISAKGGTEYARSVEQFYKYTKIYRRGWRKLYFLNRLPARLRPVALDFYNKMAWKLAKKL